MNTFLKKTLELFAVIIILGSFFSCWEGDWQYPWSANAECNVPKFYDDKQGIYKGELFLLKADSTLDTASVFIEVKMGGYADKTIEFKGIPIRCFLRHLDKGLLDRTPSDMLEKQIDVNYKYSLWGVLHEWDGVSIGPNYTGTLFTAINSNYRDCCDSIYSKDKLQKMKYCISAYPGLFEYALIELHLKNLEINDSIISQPWYQSTVKIDIGDKITNKESLSSLFVK